MRNKIIHPLKNYLKKNKIKIPELAKNINKAPATLYGYLNYRYNPSLKTALKISSITGIPIEKLFYKLEENCDD